MLLLVARRRHIGRRPASPDTLSQPVSRPPPGAHRLPAAASCNSSSRRISPQVCPWSTSTGTGRASRCGAPPAPRPPPTSAIKALTNYPNAAYNNARCEPVSSNHRCCAERRQVVGTGGVGLGPHAGRRSRGPSPELPTTSPPPPRARSWLARVPATGAASQFLALTMQPALNLCFDAPPGARGWLPIVPHPP